MELDRRMLHELIMEAAFRAVTEGAPTSIARLLDDANPVIPLAVDIDGDVAMVTLLSWSEQDSGWEPSLCNATLVRQDEAWCLNDASSGVPPRDYPLTARRPADPPGLHIRVYEAGPQSSTSRGKRWLAAALQVTAEVDTVRIGNRHRQVPFHGYVPVVVRDRRRADVAAISNDGSVLETVDLRRSDLFRELRQRVPEGWPFKIK